jgi:hypothetical protein
MNCSVPPNPTLAEEGEIVSVVCGKTDAGRRSSKLDASKQKLVSRM